MNNDTNGAISYEQFIAGALVKFELIDNVDFSLLIEDFESNNNIKVVGVWNIRKNIFEYVTYLKNGTILLRDNISLDYFIEKENITIKDKFLDVAGNLVNNYFDNLDIEKYRKEKDKLFIENKDKILRCANVLLISDIEDDYNELVKYGFKNIDYFRSIIRADKYFSKHPEELEKYHIVLQGNQNVQHCCLEQSVDLEEKIRNLKYVKHILTTSLSRYFYPYDTKFVAYLSDNKNNKFWDTNESTYKAIFDRIIEATFINHTLENVKLKLQKYSPYVDYINPNKLPLPSQKSDLKILYLDSCMVSRFAKRISQELGLNITFEVDSNSALEKYVKSSLGNYDIIIASYLYSESILNMNRESTEQCKDTGRQLTMLITYCKTYYDTLKLRYVFGGNEAPTLDINQKIFRTLRQLIDISTETNRSIEYLQDEYTEMKSIIEVSVNLFNEALRKKNKTTINDLNFKTADEFDKEYLLDYEAKQQVEKEKNARRLVELEPINDFDSFKFSILRYLDYKSKGLIKNNVNGLRIIEGKSGIRIENLYDNRISCSVAFSKEYNNDDISVFEIQTMTKKGTLSYQQMVGLYTSEYENLRSTPNRPDEKQTSALKAIEKKVNSIIVPLIDKVCNSEYKRKVYKRQ